MPAGRGGQAVLSGGGVGVSWWAEAAAVGVTVHVPEAWSWLIWPRDG